MCRSKAEGGRRCNCTSQQQDRQRRLRAARRHQQAQQSVTAFIGATPFRPESASLLSMSSRDSYYESDEWQEWSDRIQVAAERCGIELVEGTPAQNHSQGLWMGESEPSGAYTAVGNRDDIERWAADVAGYYNQDAVMVLHADPDGPDTLYSFDVAAAPGQVEEVHDAMRAAGVPGGRIVDRKLEIVSTRDAPVSGQALWVIKARLGCGDDDVTQSPCQAVFVSKNETRLAHTPIKDIQAIRQRHAERHSLPVRGRAPHLTADDNIAASMAYEAAEHTPDDPKVKRSYRSFRRHIAEQYDALTAAGYSFDPWYGETEQPYANSAEMLSDLRDHKHLFYFRTEVSQDSEGALPDDHPMAQEVIVHDSSGNEQRLCANDAFRAVHDAIAHSEGHQFGPHGESMAWWTHRSSLPREAHLALWNETRAQNVFTNAGPHMRVGGDDAAPRLLRKGEDGWLSLPDRPFAEQKCARVDDAFT